ncbi:MAG: hypothetical protein ABS948_10755 [Solibacillus sp.]
MATNFVAKSLEQQHLRSTKKYHLAIADINTELIKVHKILERCINKSNYEAVTAYTNQYISYTTIWNIKFVYNLENPEVVLMQLMHLNYILQHETAKQLEPLRRVVAQQQENFYQLRPYREEQIKTRLEKMLVFIENYTENE